LLLFPVLDDPYNLLTTNDWHTRAMIKRLAKDYRKATGYGLRIRSGRRSCAEQNAIYAKGRTAPGPIVTGASGCRSWHVTGRAVDLDPFDPATDKIFPGNSDEYRWLGAQWKKLGGKWGGDFANIYDPGHFEWHPGAEINDVCPIGMQCAQLEVRQHVPTYLIASGAVLLLTVGIFAATVTMDPARTS
jgi:hypothetical protein